MIPNKTSYIERSLVPSYTLPAVFFLPWQETLFFFFLNYHLRIYLPILDKEDWECVCGGEREGEGETKGERHHRERETWIGCLPYVPQPGMELATFWYTGRCSNQLSHLARARNSFLSVFFHWLFWENIIKIHLSLFFIKHRRL